MKKALAFALLSLLLSACASSGTKDTDTAANGAKTKRVCETVKTNQTGARLQRVCRDVVVKEADEQAADES